MEVFVACRGAPLNLPAWREAVKHDVFLQHADAELAAYAVEEAGCHGQ